MTYQKPKIMESGNALKAIQGVEKRRFQYLDIILNFLNFASTNAYEADE